MPSAQHYGASLLATLTFGLVLTGLGLSIPPANANTHGTSDIEYSATYPLLSLDQVIRQAVSGDAYAQHELANRFVAGNGLEINASRAALWYGRAASQRHQEGKSVDSLSTFPIRARGATNTSAIAPTPAFTSQLDEQALSITLDASASSASQPILRHIWSIRSETGMDIGHHPQSSAQSDFSFEEPGLYYITLAILDASGNIGYKTERVFFSEPSLPAAPVLTMPLSESSVSAGTTVQFSWQTDTASVDTHSFELYVAETPLNEAIVAAEVPASTCIDGTCQLEIAVDVAGTLSWRVRAYNHIGSSEWSSADFFVVPAVLAPPVPISPAADTSLALDTTANFEWNMSDQATRYQVQLLDSIDSSIPILSAFLPSTACSSTCVLEIDLSGLQAHENYAWQVRAESEIALSEWSTTFIRIVAPDSSPPSNPILLEPAENTVITRNTTVNFSWNSNADIQEWHFQLLDVISDDVHVNLESLDSSQVCLDTECVVPLVLDLPAAEGHQWRVRASNNSGTSDWSSLSFSVVDETNDAPGEFTLYSPPAGSTLQNDTANEFIWLAASGADSYQLIVNQGVSSQTDIILATVDDASSNCTEALCSAVVDLSLTESDNYNWKVRATNNFGETTTDSFNFNLTEASGNPLAPPTIVTPSDNTPVLAGETVLFQWTHVSESEVYDFQINSAQTDTQINVSDIDASDVCDLGTCTYSFNLPLLAPGVYDWQVRARSADSNSDWSIAALLVQEQQTQTNTISIVTTNVSGGGFQSDVTITDDGSIAYSAADVSGIFKSTDGGLTFHHQSEGLESTKIATLAITPDNSEIIYAGTGDKGVTGGLFRSVDGGDSWTITGAGKNSLFAGNHTVSDDPLPSGHPRSNGDLIIVVPGADPNDHVDDIVIAGSYKDGVRIFTQGGEEEVSSTNTSGFVRSIAYSAARPYIAYAAIQFHDVNLNGIYRIDFSTLDTPTSTLEYHAIRPEGLTALDNGHVYAAIGNEGVVKFDNNVWRLQNDGLSVNDANRQWTAVTGYASEDGDVIYAGTNNQGGVANGSNYSNIWRSSNGGETWSAVVDANTNVSDTILGQSSLWWYRIDAFQQAGLGRTNSIVSSIDVSQGNLQNDYSDDIVFVSGRGGLWKSDNGGSSWSPAVHNLQVTSNFGVAINPNAPNQVALANTDYVTLRSKTGFSGEDIYRDRPQGSESRAYDAIFDHLADSLIIGVGDRDTNDPGGGEVFIKPADDLGIPSGSGWTNTNLASETPTNNGRVRAVTYGYHDGESATSQTILAAVEGEGVFRYHEGVWTQSAGVDIGATHRSNFAWPDRENAGNVYLLDLSTGLSRSNDGGKTWTNIWPSMNFRNNDFYNTGYIAIHDDNPSTVFVSVQGDRTSPIGTGFRVFRLENADENHFDQLDGNGVTSIGFHSENVPIRRPGPIAFGPAGRLWLAEQQDSRNSVDAGFFVLSQPELENTFSEITTNDYRNAAVSPSEIAISENGEVYISQNGGGLVKLLIEED